MKTKGSEETVSAFLTVITRNVPPKKTWVDKRTEFAAEPKKFWKAEGIQLYSTMSETKTVFVECRSWSMKNILYRCVEVFGHEYFHKWTQFATTLNSRRNLSRELSTKVSVSNASAEVFRGKPLSIVTNFLLEQRNLEEQRRIGFLKISYSSLYQNVHVIQWKHFKVVWLVVSGTRSLPFDNGYR